LESGAPLTEASSLRGKSSRKLQDEAKAVFIGDSFTGRATPPMGRNSNGKSEQAKSTGLLTRDTR